MTHTNLKKEMSPPLWAVLGAPLIGVPVMVGLLALSAPKTDGLPVEPVPVVATEPLDTEVVEPEPIDSAERLEMELNAE